MKARQTFIIGLLLLLAALILIPEIFNITSVAPMHTVNLILSRDGELIPPHEIREISYRFDQHRPDFDPLPQNQPYTQIARSLYNGFFISVPFSITREGLFSTPKITPYYQSAFIAIETIHGGKLTMRIPVTPDRALRSTIQIDLGTLR